MSYSESAIIKTVAGIKLYFEQITKSFHAMLV